MKQDNPNEILSDVTANEYKYGFVTDIETDIIPKGLSEEIIRHISQKKGEPEWLLDFRLKAYAYWKTLEMPHWAHLTIPEIDYQAISYYAAPKTKVAPKSLEEVDPELRKTFDKLGISLEEQMKLSGVAVDAVMDSVSVRTTFREKLAELGVIFCSFSEAVKDYPDLVKRYLGSVVSYRDNFFAALNSAVFSDGSFVYIPKGVRCPMELSTYFRINAANTGQFERTLIVADDDSYVSYLEGCTAPMRDENQLHAAIVEIIVEKHARVRYTTVQNWSNNVYNLVTQRAYVREGGTMEWVDGNIGSKATMKYPACILAEPYAKASTMSLGFAGKGQHQDTGAKMIHLAPHTSSTIVAKSISRGGGRSAYRGLVKIVKGAYGSSNSTVCDALLVDDFSRSDTYPHVDVREDDVSMAHEATVSKISEDQLFYLMSRGLTEEEARGMIVRGFVEPISRELPMEYALELNRLVELQMEGSVG